MSPKQCKNPECKGLVPPDGPDYWQYCNDCGMEMDANRNKNNKICMREGCNTPVDMPYYSFCQKCFYSDARLKTAPKSGYAKSSSVFDERNPPPPDDDDIAY